MADQDDPVVATQPIECHRHTEPVSAVLIVYRSGYAEIACPRCGKSELR